MSNPKIITDMNTDDTIYDKDDATTYDSVKEQESKAEDQTAADNAAVKAEEEKAEKKDYTWQKVVIGGTAGIALGAVASYFTAAKAATAEETEEAAAEAADNGNPLVDNSLQIADTVTEDMPFSQAFAAARAEVGPGGVFEWHGNIYSTYTAEEWSSMSAEEQDSYNDNFAWNNGSSSSNHSNDAAQPQEKPQNDVAQNSGNSDDVPVQNVTTSHESPVSSENPEIEVLGVVHDDESGMNFGGLTIDGQEVVLIDVDGDETFDLIASDLNGDGELSENEIAELPDQSITTAHLGGFSDEGTNLYAEDEGPDYVNDAPNDIS